MAGGFGDDGGRPQRRQPRAEVHVARYPRHTTHTYLAPQDRRRGMPKSHITNGPGWRHRRRPAHDASASDSGRTACTADHHVGIEAGTCQAVERQRLGAFAADRFRPTRARGQRPVELGVPDAAWWMYRRQRASPQPPAIPPRSCPPSICALGHSQGTTDTTKPARGQRFQVLAPQKQRPLGYSCSTRPCPG